MKFPFGKILKVVAKIANIVLAIEDVLSRKDQKQKAKELRKKIKK